MDFITSALKLQEYAELVPIGLIGIVGGTLNYSSSGSKGLKHACKFACVSGFISLCVFAMLSATELPYMAKVGISASVGYFGIERAIEIVKNILNIRK
ncbi:phage holin family protein [Helicobacter suis]|uniref:phage holin family protein n=1 Tax=Helicobacter suis TaxID=104628 RepID=UPI0013D74EBB|nr:phage holin family protein [Helicobacter suis]